MDTIAVDERRVRNARIALQRAKAGSRDDAAVVRAVLSADDAWCREVGFVVAGDELPQSLLRLMSALRFVYGDDGAAAMLEATVEGALVPEGVAEVNSALAAVRASATAGV